MLHYDNAVFETRRPHSKIAMWLQGRATQGTYEQQKEEKGSPKDSCKTELSLTYGQRTHIEL